MWVKSEYAGELAVLSAWLAVLLPWNVTYSSFGPLGNTLYVRFPLVQVLYTWLPTMQRNGEVMTLRQTGFELISGVFVADPVTATVAPEGVGTNIASVSPTWLAGGVFFALAFLLSLAMYFREDEVNALGNRVQTSLPGVLAGIADPVRLMGLLLLLGSLVLAVATYQLWQSSLPGVPIPVGIPIALVLSYTLLRVDRREFEESPETGAPAEPAAETDA